ncbi:MAG: gene transfer agent family protein [Erythrobacter sp.]|nr:gene transfer agent family protein [Erythrobacter sp.]
MNKPANTFRGEAEFSIGGVSYTLRPSFEALVAAEQELGSLFALVERASEGALTLTEITALLWHCMDGETRQEREAVGAAILDEGLIAATKPVRVILAQVLQGRQ